MQNKLTFGKGNAKLNKHIFTFSLPAGFTCPGALECLSRANQQTGKITDGPATQFRCFAASQEATYKNVRESRWRNFELLRQATTSDAMAELILASLPAKATMIRIHVAGDFFNQAYFDAWLRVAEYRPDVTFYAYTKSLKFWIARLNSIPSNLHLNASQGGVQDKLIAEHGLKSARVVFSVEQAAELGLEIDHDDSHAFTPGPSFALLIHGVQPKGTPAATALRALNGVGSYGRGKQTLVAV